MPVDLQLRGECPAPDATVHAPGRVGVIGSHVSVCSIAVALDFIDSRLASGGGYVCFTNAHGAVTGRQDAGFRAITNESMLSLADGKSVYWAGRLRGASTLGHAPGPDFMMATLRRFPRRRHFFYGSTPAVLATLQVALLRLIPDLNICGACSPPFRALSEAEQQRDLQSIRESGAEFVWVGLGAPKQERWMAGNWQSLCPAILLGVGAAFDFHAGNVRRAPGVLRVLGLEWLYRLAQEPRRLWKRYLVTNSLFMFYLILDAVTGSRKWNSQ